MHQRYRIARHATGDILVRDSATDFLCLTLSPAEARDLAQRLQALATAPPTPPAPDPSPPLADTLSPLMTADVGEMLRQAAQRLRTDNAQRAATPDQATDHRHGQSPRATGDQDTGWCSLHNVAMKRHVNKRGTWLSHSLGNGRYCKGAR